MNEPSEKNTLKYLSCQARRVFSPLSNERGMALILAVSMLLILTVLGAVTWKAGISQLGEAGTRQGKQQAFFAAQRGIEYALNRDTLLTMSGTIDLASNVHKDHINAGNTRFVIRKGEIIDSGAGPMPLKYRARFGTEFGANYYFLAVQAVGPISEGRDPATVDPEKEKDKFQDIETQVVRMYRHDEDSIFRTSGGG